MPHTIQLNSENEASIIREVYLIDYRAGDHSYSSYILAVDLDEVVEITSLYDQGSVEVTGRSVNRKIIHTKPSLLFKRWLKDQRYVGDDDLHKTLHLALFCLGRMECKGIFIKGLFCDTGLIHELYHLISKISGLRECSVRKIINTLEHIESNMTEIFE
jgi:hypothetical protein